MTLRQEIYRRQQQAVEIPDKRSNSRDWDRRGHDAREPIGLADAARLGKPCVGFGSAKLCVLPVCGEFSKCTSLISLPFVEPTGSTPRHGA